MFRSVWKMGLLALAGFGFVSGARAGETIQLGIRGGVEPDTETHQLGDLESDADTVDTHYYRRGFRFSVGYGGFNFGYRSFPRYSYGYRSFYPRYNYGYRSFYPRYNYGYRSYRYSYYPRYRYSYYPRYRYSYYSRGYYFISGDEEDEGDQLAYLCPLDLQGGRLGSPVLSPRALYYAPTPSYRVVPSPSIQVVPVPDVKEQPEPASPTLPNPRPVDPTPKKGNLVPKPMPRADETFDYDGGPKTPVPMPAEKKAAPLPRVPVETLPTDGHPVSAPAPTPRYVYPAYGEEPVQQENDVPNTIFIRAVPSR